MAELRRSCSVTESSLSRNGIYLSLHGELRVTIAAMRNVVYCCRECTESYRHKRLLIEKELKYLNSIQNCSGLPTRDGSLVYNLGERLLQDHLDVRVYLENLLHAQKQQSEFDHTLLREEFHHVVRALQSLLSRMETMLKQQGMELKHNVDLSTIFTKKNDMTTDSKSRYRRDVIILKNAEAFGKSMINTYETLFLYASE